MTGFVAMAAAFAIVQASSQPMTLADALGIAEQNAFGLRLADTAIERARQKAVEARGSLGPKVTLDATYTRFDKAQTTNFGGQTIVTRPIDSKDAKLSLSMPLDLAGVTSKAIRAANLNIQVAEANKLTAKNDLRQSVKRAFFGVLQAQESVKVTEEALQRATERLENAKRELAAGVRARVDIVRLETAKSQAESDLTAAKNAVSLTKNILNNALGRPIETPVDVAAQPLWKPLAATEEDLVGVAAQTRPDLRALKLQSDLLAYVRMAEERGGVPSLNFSAVHNRTFGSAGFGSSAASTTGVVALSIPIWDSGITRARVKAARQDEEAVKLQLQQATLAVSLEVRQALLNLRNSDARVTLAEQQVKLAEETYRLTSIKFEAGEGIPLEVADASTQLTQARTQLVNARYDYLRAIADLERAVGKDLMPEGTR